MRNTDQFSLAVFIKLVANEQGVLTKERLLQPDLRRILPVIPDPGLIKDFYVLLNYSVTNRQQIKTLVIAPSGVYFTCKSTKELLSYHMAHSILDISATRALRTHLDLPANCEPSLCFVNWVAMHLSGVSSSKKADWVALHHTTAITVSSGMATRVFTFEKRFQVQLPVQRNFDGRLRNVQWMSALELEAFRYLAAEVGVPLDLNLLEENILREADPCFRASCATVSCESIGRFLLSFQETSLDAVVHHPELGFLSMMFIDFKRYFRRQLLRKHTFN
ncbi:hypothetical protein [Lapidilactobacillus luobeiensis]|uniref:hypothetical protein n=1 Tax=Lapidilactobacillus luobeiensis TaxID=2950371 RepID=UPI0021C2CBB1|nr:hypothetical protein [Lapidilactobacillus luobeiensis]